MRKLVLLTVAVVAAALVASPIGAKGAATKVSVRLFEFKLVPTPLKVKRGAVSFTARNTGKVDHELVVLKTNVAPAKLPVRKQRAVETGRVGRVGPIKPGKSRTLNLTLKAGKYVLLCNVRAHYQAGQRIGFAVT